MRGGLSLFIPYLELNVIVVVVLRSEMKLYDAFFIYNDDEKWENLALSQFFFHFIPFH